VPEMRDLTLVRIEEPTAFACGFIAFAGGFGLEPSRYGPAVGKRCRVLRSCEGLTTQCGGAVSSVEPVQVSLDGAGFR